MSLACTSLTVRPTLQPFPLATYDTLRAEPQAVIAEATAQLKQLGLEPRAVSEPEGYLETRWFDVVQRRSRRWNQDPANLIRVRVWADPVTPRETQVVIETVARYSVDRSIPERLDEAVVEPGTPGDSLTKAVQAGLRARFNKGQEGQ